MTQNILHNLNIPLSCKIGKPLFKKQFKENFSLNVNEKKILSDDIESITLEYLLNKNNININEFKDEDNEYLEVAFIKVEILNINKLKSISNIIQNIPYPLIVLYSHENSICLNLSPKRINKNDSSKLVVEDTYFTKWINLKDTDTLESDFIDSLDIHKQPFTDFLSFYNSYLNKILAFNTSDYTGNLEVGVNSKKILDEILICETKISEIKNKIQKLKDIRDKVNMNIELKEIKEKLKELKQQLLKDKNG